MSFVPIKLILCTCMIGVWMLPVSKIILFDVRIVPTMCYFLFFIILLSFITGSSVQINQEQSSGISDIIFYAI